MYEIFLTALIEDRDIHAAKAVLSGYCSMQPWESTHRVLYFQGPPRPSGISNQASLGESMRKVDVWLWKELHQNFARQSFIVQARYEILRDVDLGTPVAGEPMNLDATPGILRWTDFPDPPRGQPFLTQRKKVEIWDQRKLPSILRDNKHQFKTETVEEMHRFFRDEIEYCLTRHYAVGPVSDLSSTSSQLAPSPSVSEPRPFLPAWDSLTRLDMQDRWILQVKAHVLHDNKPDEIRKAQDELLKIRGELDGVFDFRPIDRKVHDTRVALQQQGVQALPQKVLVGQS